MPLSHEEKKHLGEIIYSIKEHIKQESWRRNPGYSWLEERMTNQYILSIMEENDIYTRKEILEYFKQFLEIGE